MTSLLAVLRSSLGKKYVMGLTGLFLCLFLLIHLGGNILLFVGAPAYNEYAHKLHSMPAFLIFSEVLLYGALLLHLYLAVATWLENNNARGPVGYSQRKTKIYHRILGIQPESMMFFTGAVMLAFMVVHVADFKFEIAWKDRIGEMEPFDKAGVILGDMTRKVIYVIGSLFVGVHVSHGFRSAFQSLGINHPKYNKLIDRSSIAFALIVAIGFASFPIWFTSVEKPSPEPKMSIPAEKPAARVIPYFRLLSHSSAERSSTRSP